MDKQLGTPSHITVMVGDEERIIPLDVPRRRILRWAIRLIDNRLGDGVRKHITTEDMDKANTIRLIRKETTALFQASKSQTHVRLSNAKAIQLLCSVLRTRTDTHKDTATELADILGGQ